VHLQVPALDMLARIQQAIPQLNDSWSNIHISYVGDILYRDRAFLNRIQADRGQIFSYLKSAWDTWFLHGIRHYLIQSPMLMNTFGEPAMEIINDAIIPERFNHMHILTIIK
jgi:hypothetical protein